ncbi:MAG: hypothetical protein P8Y47_10215 [Alphaproteobacteria bacterium]
MRAVQRRTAVANAYRGEAHAQIVTGKRSHEAWPNTVAVLKQNLYRAIQNGMNGMLPTRNRAPLLAAARMGGMQTPQVVLGQLRRKAPIANVQDGDDKPRN